MNILRDRTIRMYTDDYIAILEKELIILAKLNKRYRDCIRSKGSAVHSLLLETNEPREIELDKAIRVLELGYAHDQIYIKGSSDEFDLVIREIAGGDYAFYIE